MLFYLISSIALGAIVAFLLLWKLSKKGDFNNELINKIIKILSITYIVSMFINLFLPDGFAVNKSEEELKAINGFYQNTIRLLHGVSIIIIPLVAYYDNKYLKKIAILFCLPISIIYLFSYSSIITWLTDPTGRAINTIRFLSDEFKQFMLNVTFRSFIFGLLSFLEIIILLLIAFKDYKKCKFSKDEILPFILVLLGVIILSINSYTPQYYFGYTSLIFKRFSLAHLIVVVLIVLEIIFLYNVFKNKPQDIKHLLLLAMCISLMFQFSNVYTATGELKFQKLPLQLCNIGAYLMLFTLIKKNQRLFNFTIIVNVVGATIAMVMLDVDRLGIFYYWNVHYILEHGKVIIIPILCLLLKEFNSLKKKDFKDFFIGFSLYYLFVFVFGTITNGIYYNTGNDFFKVNFLFMFDQGVASGLLPFAGSLFDIKINLGIFVIHPVIQFLVYLVFIAFCTGVFFIIYLFGKSKSTKRKES